MSRCRAGSAFPGLSPMVTIGSSAVEERAGGSGRSGGLGEAAQGAAALKARWAHEGVKLTVVPVIPLALSDAMKTAMFGWLISLPSTYPVEKAAQFVNLISAGDLLNESQVQPGQWLMAVPLWPFCRPSR